MTAMIDEPRRINPVLRLGIWASDKAVGKRLLQARLLAWVPRAAVGAGAMEALVVHRDRTISERILKLVRIAVSLTANCAFCIDMNAHEFDLAGITDDELAALRRDDLAPTFTPRERIAITFARLLTATPLAVDDTTRAELTSLFDDREIVVLATTAAQVNFWARLTHGLGIPPAGFSEACTT